MATKFLNVSTDETLSQNSNILVPSQRAVKNFIASRSVHLNFLQPTAPEEYVEGNIWLNTTNYRIYTATSSSTWNSGIPAEVDQFFLFNTVLYYYNGASIQSYSVFTVTEQNEGKHMKLWVGTTQQFEDLDSDEYDPSTTIYKLTDAAPAGGVSLATQTQFDNSSQTTAATPYQVNQKVGNYLSLSGGNLDAGAVLRLTNTNNEVTSLAFNTSGQLTISSKLYVNNETSVASLICRTGNIYKTNTSGATVLWSDGLDNQLSTTSENAVQNKVVTNAINAITGGDVSAFVLKTVSPQLIGYQGGTDDDMFGYKFEFINRHLNEDDEEVEDRAKLQYDLDFGLEFHNYADGGAEPEINLRNNGQVEVTSSVGDLILSKKNGAKIEVGTDDITITSTNMPTINNDAIVTTTTVPAATNSTFGGVKISYDSGTQTLSISTN